METGVRVEVLLFARLREIVGAPSCTVVVDGAAAASADGASATPGPRSDAPVTARSVWNSLVLAHPRLAGADGGLRVAVSQSYASWETPVSAGDTVAFIPPVAGGSGADAGSVHVWLTTDPLDARAVEDLVRTDEDGAVCTFTGVVRNHADGHAVTDMDYEAYPGMAESEMRRIAEEALRRFPATAIAAVHRVGRLAIGEASVVVSASAHHRAAAFDACRYAIDTLKAEVPIWKKEHGPDGSVWVDERLRAH
ncbi:MAG TPA: molybdenum cofactor biosynthesis protein MoaE [Candidatus Dormibacteraeota bacterium]|jgi:molybdopterin synthase catalytic subunit|nr:molybdenum cofactor biosynthesis protein MoaE [Candidatus Dormibacteraeota bacterium]